MLVHIARRGPFRLTINRIVRDSESPKEKLTLLTDRLRQFRETRDWGQFHSPNRLAIALSVEAAEVLEHFLWIADGDADAVAAAKRDEIAEELADVLIYLIYLADRIDVNLLEAAESKMDRNEERFARPRSDTPSDHVSE